jgi:oligopeptide/dipeptide ABC transporter ATP-binding protein
VLAAESLRVVHVGPTTRPILRDVSLTLASGEIRALVGESGSGKTMTALALIGLLPRGMRLVSGRIVLGATDITALPESGLERIRGRRIAMVFQDPLASLNPVLTIGAQLQEPIRAHLDLDRKATRKRALELLDQVGLPSAAQVLRMYPHELSGGMRQRALIAVALSCDPEVLLADEPTTALDVTVQARILALLREIVASRRLSVLFVTHALGVAAELADTISVMYAGTVVESGATRAVLSAPEHPYTIGLLRSAPRLDRRERPMAALGGSVEGIWDLTQGCRFAPRCPYRINRCEIEDPILTGGDHRVACWVQPLPDRRP